MSTIHDEILKSAMQLSDEDRLLLATELIDSIDGSPARLSMDDPKFELELNRRLNDGSKPIPWHEVRRQLDQDLGQ